MSSSDQDHATAALANNLGIDPLLAKLLVLRGHQNPVAAQQFLSGSLASLPDPFSMKGMSKAVDRIVYGIMNGEKAICMADYDQDGIGAGTIVVEFFRSIGAHMDLFIPNRLKDGYGLSAEAIKDAASQGYSYIISVDCGISNISEAQLAKELNLKLIITDHHEPPEILPDAFSILNPHQQDCEFPYNELCGAGVAFFLIAAVRKELRITGYFSDTPEPDIRNLLDVCALSTIADLVPLTGLNRIITRAGLALMQKGQRVGIEALRQVAEVKKISCGTVAFGLAPRLNAAGRLADATIGANLLMESDWNSARSIASTLDAINRERQEIEREIFVQAEERICAGECGSHSIVLADTRWAAGVVGIVSSKLVEKYHVPTVLIALEGETGKGSCRSISQFHLFDNLKECEHLLTKYGGHAMAAGLGIEEQDVDQFAEQFNALVEKTVSPEGMLSKSYYDSELAIADLSLPMAQSLKKLEPFGMGNPSPVFVVRSAKAFNTQKLGKDRTHLKFKVDQDGYILDAIAFQQGHLADIIDGEYVDLLFTAGINEFRGNTTLQLEVKDVRLSQALC